MKLRNLIRYFLWLGATGFGGPIALVNAMEKDLVERDRVISPGDFRLGMALAQATPGPLAGQMVMWIGYLTAGAWGAFISSVAFLAVPFAIVIALAWGYVRFQGLPGIEAVFHGVNPAILAVIVHAAWRLIPKTLGDKKTLWGIMIAMTAITMVAKTELAVGFLLGGLIAVVVYAPPRNIWRWAAFGPFFWGGAVAGERLPMLAQIFAFFFKTGSLVLGTGFVIVPFMRQGLVIDHQWLTQQQFVDAMAVSVITPGPILITVAFIGYLMMGLIGAVVACVGIFLPIYLITIFCAPYTKKLISHPQIMAFVEGVTAAALGSLAGAALAMAPGCLPNLTSGGIFLVSVGALFWRQRPVLWVMGFSALAGWVFF